MSVSHPEAIELLRRRDPVSEISRRDFSSSY
jgi:hypothetical protein